MFLEDIVEKFSAWTFLLRILATRLHCAVRIWVWYAVLWHSATCKVSKHYQTRSYSNMHYNVLLDNANKQVDLANVLLI